ncbi:MAG: kelch repeat-containing protein [Myxococcaceae bacterium]|nr:kelch repeat-containing protein [Myxococcaceae bacterium]
MGARAVGLVALATLLACQPKVVNYTLAVVTSGCAGANPFQGVQFLRIRITGDGLMAPIDAVAPAGERAATLPEIPAGTNRVIEVRAYDGDPASGGRVVSIGRTLPFTVPDVVPDMMSEAELTKRVFLRQVNTWAAAVSATDPTSCQPMRVARAGHTATLLKNGKVFIAGGFNYPPGNPNRVALSDAEVFDPSTGTFSKVQDLSFRTSQQVVKVTKAFHTANLLKNGQVVVWGGENYQLLQGVNVVSPRSEIIFYDPDQDAYGATQRQTPAPIPRSQHRAVVDQNGKLLVIGGLRFNTTGSGPRLVPVSEVEWFDPDVQPQVPQVIAGLSAQRVEASVAPVKQGEFIAVAGGTDGTMLRADVQFFKWNGRAFEQQVQSNPPRLGDPGRRAAAAVPFREGNDMLVLGGYSDASGVRPVASSEIVQAGVATVARGADIGTRGDVCAVTLNDGSVLAIGGRTADMAGMMVRSDASTVIVRPDGRGGTNALAGPGLMRARYLHTCTLLSDGSVLVTGGLDETAANPNGDVLADAWIFTPAPID